MNTTSAGANIPLFPALSPAETKILRYLSSGPKKAEDARRAASLSQVEFDDAAFLLWNAYFLRGRLEDGCCNQPCGPNCVSAFLLDRHWQLTTKGRAALDMLDKQSG